LVRETVSRITNETFKGKRPYVLATGGDAELVARLAAKGGGKSVIDKVDPLLTLRGLAVISSKNS
jgi:pantothenate kinase type III